MKRKYLALPLLATAVLLAACGKTNQATSQAKNETLTTAVTAEMATLDPSRYSDTTSLEALQNAYEGLYRFDKNNKPVLAGAKKVTISKDKLTYTFDLRKDAKWSNGDPVVANDYVYAWRKTVDQKTASPNSQRFEPIKNGKQIAKEGADVNSLGVKALGKYKLEVTLESPISYLPELLAGAPFAPQDQKVAEKYGKEYGTSSKKAVYNGPFVIDGWTGTNLKWSYIKNKNYYAKKDVALKKVNVQVVKDTSTAAKLFQTNKLDYTALSNEYIHQYKSTKGYHTRAIPLIGYMSFNTQRETTGDVHVRKALAQAFNKELLVKKVLYAGQPLNGIVPQDFAFNASTGHDYRKDAGDMLTYNLKNAKKEWAEAKKELGKDQITIEILTSDTSESKRVGEYLQSQLEENLAGLTVKVRSIPLKSRLNSTTNYDFDVVYGTWQPDFADPINFLSDGGQYHFDDDYKNQEFWNLLNQASTTYATDNNKRWDALIKSEKLLLKDDAFTAPVYQGAMAYLLNDKVKDFQISPYGTVVFYRNTKLAE